MIGIREQYIIVIINVTNKCAFAYRICRTQVHILYSDTVPAESASQADKPSLCLLFCAVKIHRNMSFISLLYFSDLM